MKLVLYMLHEKEGKICKTMWNKEKRKGRWNNMLGCMHGIYYFIIFYNLLN